MRKRLPVRPYLIQFLLLLFTTLAIGGLWVWWRVWRGRRQSGSWHVPRWPNLDLSLGVVFLLALVLALIPALKGFGMNSTPPEITTHSLKQLLLQQLIGTFVIWAVISGSFQRELDDLGLVFSDLRGQLAEGLWGFLATVWPTAAIIVLSTLWRTPDGQHPFLRVIHAAPFAETTVWIVLNVIVAAPLVEELLFRVVLQSVLSRWWPTGGYWIVVALFAFAHGPQNAPALLPLGMILGLVYSVRRSYVTVVLIHALFNAVMLILMLAFTQLPAVGSSPGTPSERGSETPWRSDSPLSRPAARS